MNVIDLISMLQELDGNLRKSEQKVLDRVLKNPSSISSLKGEDLANAAGVSLPTVTRFCRKAGCQNFRDFKLRLAQNVAIGEYYSQNTAYKDNQSGNSDLQIMSENIVNYAMNSIQNTFSKLNYRALEDSINMMDGAKRICVLGLGGASSIMSQIMMNRLFRLGLVINVFQESIQGKMAAATLTKDDVAVVISATGSSPETINFINIARDCGAKTLSITRRDSILSKSSDFALVIDGYEDKLVLKPATIRYSFMAMIDILAFGLAYKNKENALALLRKQQTVVSQHKGDFTKDFLGD